MEWIRFCDFTHPISQDHNHSNLRHDGGITKILNNNDAENENDSHTLEPMSFTSPSVDCDDQDHRGSAMPSQLNTSLTISQRIWDLRQYAGISSSFHMHNKP